MLPACLYDIQGVNSVYTPTPTIIEAAQALYMGHSVEDISRNDVSEKINQTTKKKVESLLLMKCILLFLFHKAERMMKAI